MSEVLLLEAWFNQNYKKYIKEKILDLGLESSFAPLYDRMLAITLPNQMPYPGCNLSILWSLYLPKIDNGSQYPSLPSMLYRHITGS